MAATRLIGAALLIALTATACMEGPESPRGFRLPDGDAAAGRETFLTLECHSCHSVKGVELPPAIIVGPVRVELGGEVTRVKTYGELVSAVINPSHRLISSYPEEQVSRGGESLMLNYNDEMTIAQLVDLVAFLQPQYEVVVPIYEYRGYRYGP